MSNKNEEWRSTHMPQIQMMLMELCTKFPQAFTTDEQQVKPLKMGIYEDLKVALGLTSTKKKSPSIISDLVGDEFLSARILPLVNKCGRMFRC